MSEITRPERGQLVGSVLRSNPHIGYIILPPGHGKSYHHNPEIGLLEADTIVPCRSTPKLGDLRCEAKLSGDWTAYDREWAILLSGYIRNQRVVLLVPSGEVGIALGGTFLGSAVLAEEAWVRNFTHRTDTAEKHRKCWLNARQLSPEVHKTNESLTQWLNPTVHKWLAL